MLFELQEAPDCLVPDMNGSEGLTQFMVADLHRATSPKTLNTSSSASSLLNNAFTFDIASLDAISRLCASSDGSLDVAKVVGAANQSNDTIDGSDTPQVQPLRLHPNQPLLQPLLPQCHHLFHRRHQVQPLRLHPDQPLLQPLLPQCHHIPTTTITLTPPPSSTPPTSTAAGSAANTCTTIDPLLPIIPRWFPTEAATRTSRRCRNRVRNLSQQQPGATTTTTTTTREDQSTPPIQPPSSSNDYGTSSTMDVVAREEIIANIFDSDVELDHTSNEFSSSSTSSSSSPQRKFRAGSDATSPARKRKATGSTSSLSSSSTTAATTGSVNKPNTSNNRARSFLSSRSGRTSKSKKKSKVGDMLPVDHKPARGRGRQKQLITMTDAQKDEERRQRAEKARLAARDGRLRRKIATENLEHEVQLLQMKDEESQKLIMKMRMRIQQLELAQLKSSMTSTNTTTTSIGSR